MDQFWVRFSLFGILFGSLKSIIMKLDELSLAISWLHFLTLRKWNKAISEVEAYGASEEIATKEGDPIRSKNQ